MSTFILVHGSFHAAWNWHKVVPLLEERGCRAFALDMPGHGLDETPLGDVTLADCVEMIGACLDRIDGKAVLVAHSRNGVVISQAAEAYPDKIERLVYLAAYLVPNGRSMMDYAVMDEGSLVLQNVHPRVDIERTARLARALKKPALRALARLLPRRFKTHRLARKAYREALYHDCPDEITELANVLLTDEPNLPGFEPLRLTEARYGSLHKTYIECLEDRAVTLPLQRRMQEGSPCDVVLQLDSGHSPFFSQPEALTRLLVDDARVDAIPFAGRGAALLGAAGDCVR